MTGWSVPRRGPWPIHEGEIPFSDGFDLPVEVLALFTPERMGRARPYLVIDFS